LLVSNICKKGNRTSKKPAINKKTTVLMDTIKGLRRCSRYLIMLANTKEPPSRKQAVLRKLSNRLTGCIRLLATVPKLVVLP